MVGQTTVHVAGFPDRRILLTDLEHVGDQFSCEAGMVNGHSIQKGIDLLSSQGGGVFVIPCGFWASCPIVLKSDVELHLKRGAMLKFIKSKEAYPLIVTDYEGQSAIRTISPISSDHAHHVAITGEGMIDGSGELWRPIKHFKLPERQWEGLLKKGGKIYQGKDEAWFPTATSYQGAMHPVDETDSQSLLLASDCWDYYRPVMIDLKHSKDVLLKGVTIANSPAWCIHPFFCEQVRVDGITVRNAYWAQNGDGIDVESCRNVEISNSVFETGDDAICIKSGKGAVARKTKRPCENLWIHDCTVYKGHGGFVVGSEMSRGVRNILVERCLFVETDVGIRFKSALGRGGVVEDIAIRDIRMVDIRNEGVILTMGYSLNLVTRDEKPAMESEEDVPYFRSITMEGIHFLGQGCKLRMIPVKGRPETIRGITLNGTMYEGEVEIS